MYDEFERAVTGRTPRRGMGPFGWILATFAFFVAVGILGVGFVAMRVVDRVQDVKHELGMAPDLAAARVATRIASAPELVGLDPQRGIELLSGLDGRGGGKELLKAFLDVDLDVPDAPDAPDVPAPARAPEAPAAPHVSGDPAEGTVRIHTGGSDVRFDFRSAGDHTSFTIDGPEGAVSFDLEEGSDGPRIHVSAGDRELDMAFGADAERAPEWVSGLGDVPGAHERVVSLVSEEGRLGAVAWEAGENPLDVLTRWRSALEGEGFEVRAEHHVRDGGGEHASLWARDEAGGRMVFVVAHLEHRDTGVLLGYGEKR